MEIDQSKRISWVLFWTFWAIYLLASLGTLGMLFFDFGTVKENERQLLINSFLVETAIAISALFYSLFKLKKKEMPMPPAVTGASVSEGLEEKKYDVFIAAPMASFNNNEEYVKARNEVMKVYNALVDACQYKVYCALSNCETMDEFNAKNVSAIEDIDALKTSRIFIMILPRKMYSGVIFEAGYALSRKMFSVYFVEKRSDLPFMMQELPDIYEHVQAHAMNISHSYDCVAKMIRRDKHNLFKVGS